MNSLLPAIRRTSRHGSGRRRSRGAAGAVLLLAIIVAFAVWWFWPFETLAPRKTDVPADPRPVAARGSLADDEQNNVSVFKTSSPSAVNITTLELARSFLSLDIFQVPKGTGTGIVWDDQGHVVTNFHVVQGGSAARVTLADQSIWKAELVGVFPDRDLAVLRIDAPKDKLRPIVVGTSKDLQVGQKVYAIGNPFGLDQTLTTGIISALNREIESVTRRAIRGVIQTDAAINPGNSGGPLLDSAGRLIGVNTAIASPTGAFSGIGFAIPVDEVNRIVPRLIKDGRFVRPVLGIQVAPLEYQSTQGIEKGVAVIGVAPRSPADQAGIKAFQRDPGGELVVGDIITAVGGMAVSRVDQILDALELHKPGDMITLNLVRPGGKPVELQVKLGASE